MVSIDRSLALSRPWPHWVSALSGEIGLAVWLTSLCGRVKGTNHRTTVIQRQAYGYCNCHNLQRRLLLADSLVTQNCGRPGKEEPMAVVENAKMRRLREGVLRSLPELSLIKNEALRNKCVEAWALALSETEFESLDDVRGSGNWNTPKMKGGRSQATHLRGVAMMALAMADALEKVVGPIGVDRDLIVAGGLCHDLGKPFEFSPRNHERWRARPQTAGWPSVRHPVYGAHIALTVGLPEAVVNAACAHSREGEFIRRSLETTCIHHADHAFWNVMTIAGEMESEETDYLK